MIQRQLFILLCTLQFIVCECCALNVTIIESQSFNTGHVMDTVWKNLLTTMGHNATISPQTTLDNIASLAGADALIITSGVGTLPANRVAVVQQYLLQGHSVYLQCEYLKLYDTDAAFQSICNALGTPFSWNTELSGDLNPTIAMGSFATTPNSVTPLNYYWYGVEGCPTTHMVPILQYMGYNLGMMYMNPNAGQGNIAATTDQDWIRSADNVDLALMQNIFEALIDTGASSGSIVSTLALGNDTTLCLGDTLVLQAGTMYNGYTWSNGATTSSITVTGPGTYWATGTTSFCGAVTDTILINYINCSGQAPIAALSSSDTLWCDKTCIDFFDNSQFQPTSWTWYFQGALPSTSSLQNPTGICYNLYGTFDVSLVACNANGCDSIFYNDFVTEFQLPAVPTVTIQGDTFVCSAAPAYQWYNVNNITQVLSTLQWFVPSVAGNYFVLITDTNGCQVPSATTPSSVGMVMFENSGIEVFPNPVQNLMQITNPYRESLTVTIYDATSRIVFSGVATQAVNNIDISTLTVGVYSVQIAKSNTSLVRRIIKQ